MTPTKRRILSTLAISALISGCASFPDNYQDEIGIPDVVNEYSDAWSSEPAIRYAPSASGASISRYFTLPEAVANRSVHINLSADVSATINDLIAAMRAQGYRVVSNLVESSSQQLMLRQFSGTLGDFVEELSHVQNVAYEFRSGILFIIEANRYSVTLPQHEELLLQVAASLTEMGATNVRSDLLAGMVHFEARPSISGYITEYLERIAQNSAMVKLQIAVVTVGLNRDLNVGLDWSSIMAKTGTKDMLPGVIGGVQTNSNPGVSAVSGSGDSGSGIANAALAMGHSIAFNGASGLGYIFNSNSFSLGAAIKAMSTYGNAKTEQNVVLGTVSGMPVRISSGNDIPYVKSIGSTTASGGSTTGSSQTEIIRSGLDLEIIPNFDSQDNSVVTSVKVTMSSLVGFRELSAGLNLGTLSQPEMQNLEFENVGRLRAGETVVIGGITYDQLSNNYNNLPGLERLPTGSKAEKTNKNAIYIIIRPTVIIFTKNAHALEKAMREQSATSDETKRARAIQQATQQATQHQLSVREVVDTKGLSDADYEPIDIKEKWIEKTREPAFQYGRLPSPAIR